GRTIRRCTVHGSPRRFLLSQGRANQQHGPFLVTFLFDPHEPGVITVVTNVDYYIRESWKKLFPVSNVAQCWSDRSALRSGRSSTNFSASLPTSAAKPRIELCGSIGPGKRRSKSGTRAAPMGFRIRRCCSVTFLSSLSTSFGRP